MKDLIEKAVEEFCKSGQGSSGLDKAQVFVRGSTEDLFAPFEYVKKKLTQINHFGDLQSDGFVYSSLDYLEIDSFDKWYQEKFHKKLTAKHRKTIGIIHYPDTKKIFDAVEIVDQVYSILKKYKVLVNGKNLPIQLGEWYAKSIFGLKQIKSSSQRGFDFYTYDDKKVEVTIHWHDVTSLKGVKLKKSLLEMSDASIIMYVSKKFTIRDVIYLDSSFILRKFAGKGHTIFLKDSDVSSYFFSRSDKHYGKIVNRKALLQFATPNLAMKVDEKIESKKVRT